MKIKKEIKNQLNLLREKTPKYERHGYAYYVEQKKYIKKYYNSNRERLLDNERSLIKRYNELYNKTDNNVASPKALTIAIVSGIMATLFYSLLYQNGSEEGILTIIVKAVFNVSENEILLEASIWQQLLMYSVLILMFAAIVAITATLIFIPIMSISRAFSESKLDIDLLEYEVSVIKDLLINKYAEPGKSQETKDEDKSDQKIKDTEQRGENMQGEKDKDGFWNTFNGEVLKLAGIVAIIMGIIAHKLDAFHMAIDWFEYFILGILIIYALNLKIISGLFYKIKRSMPDPLKYIFCRNCELMKQKIEQEEHNKTEDK